MEALEAVSSNWSFDFLKKSAKPRSCYNDRDGKLVCPIFPGVPDLLRHMAEISLVHGYLFETILPLLQSLNNARK